MHEDVTSVAKGNRTVRSEWKAGDEISVFAIGTTLLRNRWRILRWTAVGGSIAALIVFARPARYVASASFIPQGTDVARSGLANLADQLGVAIPTANQTLSPDFYRRLLKSRVLLGEIADDTLIVQEMGGKQIPFVDLFERKGKTRRTRQEEGVKLLTRIVETSVDKPTGIVELTVATRWPSVSLAITNSLVSEVNEFNQATRQAQAAAERKFVEGRLAVARSDLRTSEDRLQGFLQTNRGFSSSPELMFDRDRLQRDVAIQQQVFTALTEAYEDVRIREVRDTPVITLIESPSVAATPESRGRAMRVLLGLFAGAVFGIALAFIADAMTRVREEGDVEADEFVGALGEVKGEILSPIRSLKKRIRG